MNTTEIDIVALFDVTMQAFVDAWRDPETKTEQVLAAYGGAACMLLLVKQTIKAELPTDHAAKLLNKAAEHFGLPQTN